jgi:hypothetical protein
LRDPAQVSHAGGLYQVMPVGVFQPANDAPESVYNDLSLSRCMVREFSEELLGTSEDYRALGAPPDYGHWAFYQLLTGAREVGKLHVACLGVGVDPLTFAVDILTVAVFDGDLSDSAFGALVTANAEGRQAAHRGWWYSYADALPSWFGDYVGLEDGAKSKLIYENQLVPSLMQTGDYAVAITRAARPWVDDDEVERQVAARTTRQALLTAPDPLQVWAVLDEAVLRRKVGGAATMRAQLLRLGEISALPNVTLQVIPFDAGAHASMGTSFSLLHFPEAGDSPIVYIENHTSSQYLETRAEIERYTLVFDHLRASALSPERSADFIGQVAAGMT